MLSLLTASCDIRPEWMSYLNSVRVEASWRLSQWSELEHYLSYVSNSLVNAVCLCERVYVSVCVCVSVCVFACVYSNCYPTYVVLNY